jgi:hypothetical protein
MDTHQVRPLNRKRMLRIVGWLSLGAGAATWAAGAVSGWPGPRDIGQTLLVMGAVFLAISLFASREPYRPGQLRHMRQGLLAAAIYMALVLAMKPLLDMASQPMLRAGIALLPVVPMVFMVRAMVRKLLEGDELERRMQLEAVSIASISVGLLSFAAASLDMAGVLHINHALEMVLPALLLAYVIALLWIRRRYQGP